MFLWDKLKNRTEKVLMLAVSVLLMIIAILLMKEQGLAKKNGTPVDSSVASSQSQTGNSVEVKSNSSETSTSGTTTKKVKKSASDRTTKTS